MPTKAEKDYYRRHHEGHIDMDRDTCLLSRCALHYPKNWDAWSARLGRYGRRGKKKALKR